MSRKLPAVIASLCLLTACSGSGTQESSTSTSTAARTDSNRAALLPLRTSDLPTGFAAIDVRATAPMVMISQCLPSLLTANATQIGETFVRDDDEISSQSYVVDSTNAARDVMTTLSDPNIQTCLSNLLQAEFDASRVKHGVQDVPTTASMGVHDAAAVQMRLVAARSDAGMTQTVATGDLLLCQSDRSVTAVWVNWFPGSPDPATENTLITALRARATAAFSEP